MRYFYLSSECVIRFGVYSRSMFYPGHGPGLAAPASTTPVESKTPPNLKYLFLILQLYYTCKTGFFQHPAGLFNLLLLPKFSFHFTLAVFLGNITPFIILLFAPGQPKFNFNQATGKVNF